MKAMLLYALTALVTGLHNLYRVMGIVNGASVNLLNCAALMGSMVLFGGAVLVPFKPRLAARLALAGSFLTWVFYAPLIAVSLFMPYTAWLEIRSFVSFREYIELAGVLFGPPLLIAATVTSILFFRRRLAPIEVLR